MLPALLIVAACAFLVALLSAYAYRSRMAVHASGDSDDEDGDDPENENDLRIAAETSSLIDGESSGDSGPQSGSLYSYLGTLFGHPNANSGVGPTKSHKQKNAALMRRRNNGTKKIHKPSFYPLLDETASWYANWEAKKQQASTPKESAEEERIDKIGRDLLAKDCPDGADCSSMISYRSNSHTIIPIACI